MWYHNLGADIIVTHFWCDLKVAMVGVNAVSILVIMDMFRRQILFIKINWFGFWSKFLVDGLVKLESIGFVYITIALIAVKVSKRQSTDILSVGQEDLCGEHGSNVDGRSKVSSKDHFVVREFGRVMVHYPIKPTELAYSADIGGLSGHNSLWNLSGGHENAVSQARADHRHQYDTVIPEFLWGTGFNHQSGYTSLEFPDISFGGLHPLGEGFRLSQVAIGFSAFASEVS